MTDRKTTAPATEIQRSVEQEGIWQQIQQHFQTMQSSLSVRLVCEGKPVQTVDEIRSGIKEAARLFALQNSPIKAEELVASQENAFVRKSQQWEQVARAAEARERAKATGGIAGSSSTANRRKLETEHNRIRHQITNVKQCLRRLRTALNRGVGFEQKNPLDQDGDQESETQVDSILDTAELSSISSDQLAAQSEAATVDSPSSETIEEVKEVSKFLTCFQNMLGDGLSLEYKNAPFLDPFSDAGVRSREAIWADGFAYCLVVQWEESPENLLILKFWIVPKRPELAEELQSDELPSFFLHNNQTRAADKLQFELVGHSSQNGPLTSEMNQLFTRIESDRFLTSDQKIRLCYLTCSYDTKVNFDSAIAETFLLEVL